MPLRDRPVARGLEEDSRTAPLRDQPSATPNSRPIPNVTAPASPPSSSMRAPECHALRPVKSESVAPMANSATQVTPTDVDERAVAGGGEEGDQRQRGARRERRRTSSRPRPAGEPSSAGLRPSSSRASVSSACSGSATICFASLVASRLRQSLGGVDERELLRFRLGILLQLVALEADLVLEELALRAHRHVFARGHRERAGGESRDARYEHEARDRCSRPRRRG